VSCCSFFLAVFMGRKSPISIPRKHWRSPVPAFDWTFNIYMFPESLVNCLGHERNYA
jgi:hypothetical protein